MTKKCQIDANKSVLVGNNVSHSNRKNKKKIFAKYAELFIDERNFRHFCEI